MERADSSSLHIESLNLESHHRIRNNNNNNGNATANGVVVAANHHHRRKPHHHRLHHSNRRRSLSVASGQPSVETVIVKAKRAASSLWMLLHAQNCNLAAGCCQHSGCQEAKLMHLHLKCCPAMATADSICPSTCPTNHRGCNQARKLLAHYRRCRNIRARQVGCRADQQQHSCLVCSLVARQARSVLEQKVTRVSPSNNHKRKHPILSSSSFTVGEGHADDELDFGGGGGGKRPSPPPPTTTSSSPSPPPPALAPPTTTTTNSAKKKMPPPPPRGFVVATAAPPTTSSSSSSAVPHDVIVETKSPPPDDAGDGHNNTTSNSNNSNNNNKQQQQPEGTQSTRDRRAQSFSQMELDASTTLANLVRPRSSSVGCAPPVPAPPESSSSTTTAHVKNGSNSTCETIAEEASLGSKESVD